MKARERIESILAIKVGDEVARLGTTGKAWEITSVVKVTATQIIVDGGKRYHRCSGIRKYAGCRVGSSSRFDDIVPVTTEHRKQIADRKKENIEAVAERVTEVNERTRLCNLFAGTGTKASVSGFPGEYEVGPLTTPEVEWVAKALRIAAMLEEGRASIEEIEKLLERMKRLEKAGKDHPVS